MRQLLRRQLGDGAGGGQQRAEHRDGVAGGAGEARRKGEPRSAVLRDADARSRHQVVRHAAAPAGGDAAHRVDDVLVEAREEAEAVLAGHPVHRVAGSLVGVPRLGGPEAGADRRNGNAARLAARDGAPFENDHLEAALGQLVRGRHPADPAAEHDDSSHERGVRARGGGRCRTAPAASRARPGRCRSPGSGSATATWGAPWTRSASRRREGHP
ncbi:hypothetical protein BH23GEM7_BH23GEM7_29330 [soil metagenome]